MDILGFIHHLLNPQQPQPPASPQGRATAALQAESQQLRPNPASMVVNPVVATWQNMFQPRSEHQAGVLTPGEVQLRQMHQDNTTADAIQRNLNNPQWIQSNANEMKLMGDRYSYPRPMVGRSNQSGPSYESRTYTPQPRGVDPIGTIMDMLKGPQR